MRAIDIDLFNAAHKASNVHLNTHFAYPFFTSHSFSACYFESFTTMQTSDLIFQVLYFDSHFVDLRATGHVNKQA